MLYKILLILILFCAEPAFSQKENNSNKAKTDCKIVYDSINKRSYYTLTETFAKYPESNELMMAFIKNNLSLPDHAFQSNETLFFCFIVEANGKLTFLKMLKPFNDELIIKEVIRVVKTMPSGLQQPAKTNQSLLYLFYQ